MTTPGWPPAAQPVSWTNDDLTKDQHPSAHNQVAGLVNLIVAVLGNDPAGGSANATARFAAIEAAVTAAQGDIGVWLAKNTLRTGSDVPPPELGIDGDAYFRDVTKTLYVKAAGGWGSPLSLVGDKGDKGDKGDTGDVGPASTVPGPKGDKGNKGDTGDPGPAGGDITNADELPFDPGTSGLTSSDAGAALRELAEGVASAELVEVHTSAHGAITLDVNAAAVHVLKLSGSAVLTFTGAPELPKAGALTVVVEQPVTPALLTWPSSVRWSDNVVPNVLSGERTAVFTFLSYDGGATWLGALGIQRATNPTGGL